MLRSAHRAAESMSIVRAGRDRRALFDGNEARHSLSYWPSIASLLTSIACLLARQFVGADQQIADDRVLRVAEGGEVTVTRGS